MLVAVGLVSRSQPLAARQGAPVATLEPATTISFPAHADSNSPLVWSLVSGRQYLYILNSVSGGSTQSRGLAVDKLAPLAAIKWSPTAPLGGSWIEAIVPDPSSSYWYGFYHNERENVVCPGSGKVIPRIGAARSSDRGLTWRDLGIVVEAPPATERCDTQNHFFVGGVGDFTVLLDKDQQFLYFYYTQYFEKSAEVGVAVARMTWANRTSPTSKATVWNAGAWLPGSTQRVLQADGKTTASQFVYRAATPMAKAFDSWDGGTPAVDVFWGPSIHWNTALGMYVMLLNRANSLAWAQEGIYVSYSTTLDPRAWSPPAKLLGGGEWYPQVVGLEPDGTDKQAGALARFFMGGRSQYLIRFSRE